MTRIKRGFVAKKRRKKILNMSKSFVGSHSRLFTAANQQVMKSKRYSYFDRRKKKSYFRSLWIKRINAGSKKEKFPYSQIINKMKRKKIILNRKIISEIILKDFTTFKKIINYLEKPLH
jgi:large subunit ribosomal protein L20